MKVDPTPGPLSPNALHVLLVRRLAAGLRVSICDERSMVVTQIVRDGEGQLREVEPVRDGWGMNKGKR